MSGTLIRNLRVATYLVSRGWVMRDSCGEDNSIINIRSTNLIRKHLEYLSFENGVRMFPPKTWTNQKARKVLEHAFNNYYCGMTFDPPVVVIPSQI